jgi:hypothetical protein
MARCCKYTLIRLDTQALRGERLNLGIAVLNDDKIVVHLAKSLKKIQAISSALDEGMLRRSLTNLPSIDDYVRPLCRSNADRLVKLAAAISDILRRLVEPEPALLKQRVKSSPLLSTVKKAFRDGRVMAKKGEGLSNHRIIAGLQLAEGLSADLALKNGAMHVIETVDTTKPDTALRKIISDIAVSALVIEQAKIIFGETETKGRLVYHASATTEMAATAALEAAAHQGIELINWASDIDKMKFINTISLLAIPIEIPNRSRRQSIHGSTQQKFSLN